MGQLHRVTRSISNSRSLNNSASMKEVLQEVITSKLKKICHPSRNFNVCPRGLPGPPGRRGRKGKQGIMGPPGRGGKKGMMGPPEIRGEKGIKGDIGPLGNPGVPGIKGEPGESISTPDVKISPPKVTVNESDTASILCSASGNPPPKVYWSRVNGSLPSNKTKVTPDGRMQVEDVKLQDAGNYTCLAQNILGKDEGDVILVVQSQPKVSLSFGSSYVEKGKNITLPECHVISFPPAVISWSKLHGQIEQDRAFLKDGQLLLMNSKKEDSGLYKCTASNKLGQDSAVTHLSVVELPQFSARPPPELQVSKRLNFSVPCQANGDPKPKVTWVKENGELPLGRSKVDEDGTLQIWNAKQEDSGEFTCMATSAGIFKAISAMKLSVRKPVCEAAGVEERNIIPDSKMTASSITNEIYKPSYGRLNEQRGSKAWSPKTKTDRADYLQVDMGKVHYVCAVGTQGSGKDQEWTISYKLRLSTDGVTWKTYKENNIDKVFPANADQNTIVKNSVSSVIKARYVRFYPVTFHSFPVLRVEIFVLK